MVPGAFSWAANMLDQQENRVDGPVRDLCFEWLRRKGSAPRGI